MSYDIPKLKWTKEYRKEYMRLYLKRWKERNPEKWKTMQREKGRRQRAKWKERRKMLAERLGGSCKICEDTKYLELQHLSYPNGDPYKTFHHQIAARKIVMEAEQNPGNFVLLCHRCHLIATFYTPQQLIELSRLVTRSSD